MRAVIQRVKHAKVTVGDETVGQIAQGMVVLLGIHRHDTSSEIDWMVEKIVNLRIFDDENGAMNLSLFDLAQEMLIVSQFTLYGDCRKGRRPGYSSAAPPDLAEPLYLEFVKKVTQMGIKTATGKFGAMMEVHLVGDGPVTLLLDSEKTF